MRILYLFQASHEYIQFANREGHSQILIIAVCLDYLLAGLAIRHTYGI